MPLTRAEVEHVAELAKLQLTSTEIEQFIIQLSDILDHAAELNQLNTDAIPPTASVLPLRSVLAEDVAHDPPGRAMLQTNAPDFEAGQIRVQAVFD